LLRAENDSVNITIGLPEMRRAFLSSMANALVPVQVSYRGLRRIEELRSELKADRIFEPFGILLDGRYFGADLADATTEAGGRYSVAVLFCDVDHFKKVNDTYGHRAGDMVLKEVFAKIRDTVAGDGSVYRIGGEEVVGLLPGIDEERAVAIAERIRSATETTEISFDDKALRVTVSIGVAASPPRVGDLRDIADDAMYRAKETGRNRVVVADASLDQPYTTRGQTRPR